MQVAPSSANPLADHAGWVATVIGVLTALGYLVRLGRVLQKLDEVADLMACVLQRQADHETRLARLEGRMDRRAEPR